MPRIAQRPSFLRDFGEVTQMFDSLEEQLKKVEQQESTMKERLLRYLTIAAVSVLIFGGIIVAVQKFQ